MAQAQIQIPILIKVGEFAFNPQTLVVVDLRNYEAGEDGRVILINLLHVGEFAFDNDDADDFYKWYLSIYSNLSPLQAV